MLYTILWHLVVSFARAKLMENQLIEKRWIVFQCIYFCNITVNKHFNTMNVTNRIVAQLSVQWAFYFIIFLIIIIFLLFITFFPLCLFSFLTKCIQPILSIRTHSMDKYMLMNSTNIWINHTNGGRKKRQHQSHTPGVRSTVNRKEHKVWILFLNCIAKSCCLFIEKNGEKGIESRYAFKLANELFMALPKSYFPCHK